MILRSSPPSPFGRKVKMVLKLTGLYDRVEQVPADTGNPNDVLRLQNPLGKIPVLILDDGSCLYDSPVICEYLDSLHDGPKLFPAAGAARWHTLTLQALADGILDAAVLQMYEKRFRPEEIRHPDWVAYQQAKIDRALAQLDNTPPDRDGPAQIGTVSLACALGYLDFRFHGAWRDRYPMLVRWLADFADRVPAFNETTPHD